MITKLIITKIKYNRIDVGIRATDPFAKGVGEVVMFPPFVMDTHGNDPLVLVKFGLQEQAVTEQHSEQVEPEFCGQSMHPQSFIS
jgi:hypothetical protein